MNISKIVRSAQCGVLSALVAMGMSAAVADQGTPIPGSNLSWSLSSGVLTISGTGAMPDFESGTPWYSEDFESVIIQQGVTSIGAYAFYDFYSLASVTIPSSVTSIGEGAFTWCCGLTSMTIPQGVTSIGEGAFSCCEGLESVTISEGVTSIGAYAFSCCEGLESVTIPSGVTSIGERAFYDCDSLAKVTIPSSVTSIGKQAFCRCKSLDRVTVDAAIPPVAVGIFEDVGFYVANGNILDICVPKASEATYKMVNDWRKYAAYINRAPLTIDSVASVLPWESAKGEIKVDYSVADFDADRWYKLAFEITAGGKTASVTNEPARLLVGPQKQKVIETTKLFGTETIDDYAKIKVSLIKWAF